MPNWFTDAISDWALKRVNPEADYDEALNSDRPEKVHPLTDAGWRKYLGKSYDPELIIDNKNGTYRMPLKTEQQITADTTFIKNRINKNKIQRKGLAKQNPNHPSLDMFDLANKSDSIYLDKLRGMYKTGEPIVVNEYEVWKDRKLVENGGNKYPISPLNVLRNFTLRPNASKGIVEYEDVYDLDKVPFVDRMFNPFKFKGTVPGVKYKGIKNSNKIK